MCKIANNYRELYYCIVFSACLRPYTVFPLPVFHVLSIHSCFQVLYTKHDGWLVEIVELEEIKLYIFIHLPKPKIRFNNNLDAHVHERKPMLNTHFG